MSILIWNVRGMIRKVENRMLEISLNLYLLIFWPWLKLKSNSKNLHTKMLCTNTLVFMSQLSIVIQRKNMIAWRPKIWTCTVYAVSIQQITLHVKNKGGLERYMTIVLDSIAKLLISQVMCFEQPLSRYHLSLRLGVLMCNYIKH